MAYNYRQGRYKVKNTDKYVGSNTNPRYLSDYELKVFQWCDRSPSVLKWGAEVVIVPYNSQVKGRKSRYIVDIYLKWKDKRGNIREELCEIKPFQQTQPPKRGRKRKDVFLKESETWCINQEKWKAATKYAEDRGWKFRVITEKSIYR